MLLDIWANLTGQKVVYLKDHDGEITKTVAKATPFGYVAKRWWPTNVCNALLLPDGKVEGAPYVDAWRFSSTCINRRRIDK